MTYELGAKYLSGHELTAKLRTLGLDDDQLDGLRFTSKNDGWQFEFWSFTWLNGTPFKAWRYFKAYCALKWLVLEDPPSSRDREDAWRCVSDAMRFMSDEIAAPILAFGLKMKETQSLRAKRPRGKISDDGKTVSELIQDLALSPEHRDKSAKELWPYFYAKLDELGLAPCESAEPGGQKKNAYQYDFRGRRKEITLRRFENIVSSCRKESR